MVYLQKQFLPLALYLAITCLICSHGQADTNLNLHASYRHALNQIGKLGVKRIGGQKIISLEQKAEGILFSLQPSVTYLNQDDTIRETAIWARSGPNFISTQHLTKLSTEDFSQIILHETLPRVGVSDENFVTSSIIQVLTNIKTINDHYPQNINNPMAQKALVNRLNNSSAEGGVTAVGGGGDYRVAYVVRLVVWSLFNQMNAADASEDTSVKKFNQVMDRLEKLDINITADPFNFVPFYSFEYNYPSRKLYIPSESADNLNFEQVLSSVNWLIENLAKESDEN